MPNCTDCSKKGSVKVVIPLYKSTLSFEECLSFERTQRVLCNYPIVVVHPKGLDISSLSACYPSLQFFSFQDDYFQGITGYNKLMLSAEFYHRFEDVEYILIVQTDAFVFRDELSQWCDKGYDYIGAPWLKKPIYNNPFIALFLDQKRISDYSKGRPNKQNLYGKIGNGGFSLRRVDKFLQVLESDDYRDDLELFRNHEKNHLFNEDVFWGTIPKEFNYPKEMEALEFAFDKYPALSWRLTNHKLPFGCHGWNKRKMRTFWKQFNLKDYDREN